MTVFNKSKHAIPMYTYHNTRNGCLIIAWTANIILYRDRRPPCWLMVIAAVGNCLSPVKLYEVKLREQATTWAWCHVCPLLVSWVLMFSWEAGWGCDVMPGLGALGRGWVRASGLPSTGIRLPGWVGISQGPPCPQQADTSYPITIQNTSKHVTK